MGIGVGDTLNPLIAARIAKAETEANIQAQKLKETEQKISENNGTDIPGYTSEEILKINSHEQDDLIMQDVAEQDVKINVEQKDIENIPDGCVLVIGGPCGVILKPKEHRIEDNFIIIILDNKYNRSFLLSPGSKLKFYYRPLDEQIKILDVYYSGISFEHGDDFILIFHIVRDNYE